jgi:DNA polymerase V
MRRQGLATANLTVFIETNPFREQDPQYHASRAVTLPVATANTAKLIAAAQRALDALWRPGYRDKKAGVMLLNLVKADRVQGGLFDAPDDARAKARMRTVDAINGRFGRDTVTFSVTGKPRAWTLRSDMLSPRYTTEWDELLPV